MSVIETVDLRRTYRTTTGTVRRRAYVLFRVFEIEGRRRASLEAL
jgi:hypothetical protein